MSIVKRLSIGRSSAAISVSGPDDAKDHGLDNWSLKPLQKQWDVRGNRALAVNIARELGAIGAAEAFAPHVAPASAQIAQAADLTDHIVLRQGVVLHRNQSLPADGLFLRPEQTFVMSGAGCSIILAAGGDHLIVAHAARDSLIDRGAVEGTPTRKHVSIVNNIVEELRKRGVPLDAIRMAMLFAIPAKDFEHDGQHPTYGAYNRALFDFVNTRWPGGILQTEGKTCLDLEQIFIEQVRREGIRTAWAESSLSSFPELAHTRDGKGTERRNLLVVKREA